MFAIALTDGWTHPYNTRFARKTPDAISALDYPHCTLIPSAMSSYGPRDPSLITEVTRRAMATEFAVLLPARHSDAVEPVVEALEQLDAIEAALTVYQHESEISRLNRDA